MDRRRRDEPRRTQGTRWRTKDCGIVSLLEGGMTARCLQPPGLYAVLVQPAARDILVSPKFSQYEITPSYYRPSTLSHMTPMIMHPIPSFRIVQRLRSAAWIPLLLMFCAASGASAQEAWREFDLGLQSGFPVDTLELDSTCFSDPLNGYVWGFRHNTEVGYRTTNGGNSWTPSDPYPYNVIFPERIFSDRFAYTADGRVSYDSGISYTRLVPQFQDTTLADARIIHLAAWSRQNMAVLVADTVNFYNDDLRRGDTARIYRLLFTLDGGNVWRSTDELVLLNSLGSTGIGLGPNTLFGALPSPVDFDQPFLGWGGAIYMPDSATVRLIAFARQTLYDTARVRYYLGTIDLLKRAATWQELPLWRNTPSETILANGPGSDVRFLGEGVLYASDSVQLYADSWLNIRYYDVHSLARSTDDGNSWTVSPLPSWAPFNTLRFTSARARLIVAHAFVILMWLDRDYPPLLESCGT